LLAGGSNVVAADAGFPGTVVRIASRGIGHQPQGDARVLVEAQAGENWDSFVAACIAQELSGIECLSGIPGSVGATPIQNVGAYGQEVRETIQAVRVLERRTGTVRELPGAACGFSYRSSAFKRVPDRWVVLAVRFILTRAPLSAPIRYDELARVLAVAAGQKAPLREVREAVLELRRGKGMVLDPRDPDSVSAGSFFTNPILSAAQYEELQRRATQRLGEHARPPAWREPDGRVKTSAAWLVERAGFHKGYGNPRGIAISSKHTLALTNRGEGTTAELVALARKIAGGVREAFGVQLVPEPVFVGHEWEPQAPGVTPAA
jgi:UDP-N-acetylmuramate dehydrogenase